MFYRFWNLLVTFTIQNQLSSLTDNNVRHFKFFGMKKIAFVEFTKFLFLSSIAGLFIFATRSDKPPSKALEKLIERYYSFHKQYPQQKIYIQTDKPYYISGDEMYGKVYLVNETRWGVDSVRSKKIYVELINAEDKVVEKAIVNGLYSSLNFAFHLPDSIAEGNYTLRAYTSWMIGFNNAQNIFRSNIPVFNMANHLVSAIAYADSTLSSVDIQLKDTLGTSYGGRPVTYQLFSRKKVLEDSTVTTNNNGMFSVNISAVPKENRSNASIKIKSGKYQKLLQLPVLNNDMDIQFLPEGGYLVNGIENNVAFIAIDKSGSGTNVHGIVKDNKGDTVCSFRSAHAGMGEFQFIPGSRKSYTAYVSTNDGREFTYPLSPSNNYGYQLSVVKRSEDSLTVRVALGDSLYNKNKATYIVATSHGGVYFTSQGTGMYDENISLKEFPEGIAQLTLFDSAMQPASERLIYVHHPTSKMVITTNKKNYRRREKVILQLKTVDQAGKLLKGIYSISVTDDHVVKHDDDRGNIKTSLLLSPYLKGYIEEPGYYFKDNSPSTLGDLDLVMLTHGWSRFGWNQIVNGIKVRPKDNDSSLSLSGKITTLKNTPAVHYTVTLMSKSDNAYIGTDVTNEEGQFHFNGIDYTDTTLFVIQTTNPKGKNENVNISIEPIPFPLNRIDRSFGSDQIYSNVNNGIRFYKSFMYDSLEDSIKAKILKEVIISKKMKKLNYDESTRVSAASYVITPDILNRYGNGNVSLNDLLQMVPGFTGHDGQISFFGLNGYKNSTPLVIVDGIEIPGVGIGDISPQTVSYIEVLRGGEAAIYGVRGGGGAIVIHTKNGADMNMSYFKQIGIKGFKTNGYQVAKQFYAPKYETDQELESKLADYRTTIYWNGYVTTNSKTPTTISFYTADMPTTYTLTIEGIAENGDLIHETIPIERTRK